MDWRREWKWLGLGVGAFAAIFVLPVGTARFDGAVLESLHLLKWYAREHVLLCLIPAFFIAGAITVFVSQASVMKYLGAGANKVLAYAVASVSGAVLAVCSCTPLTADASSCTDTCCPPEEPQTAALPRAPVDGPGADEELAAFAKAIAHPVRVRILRMLSKKEAHLCSHIVDELPLAQSTVSEHLRILRTAGLVQANENGPRVSYCIVRSSLRRLNALLGAV